MKKSIEPTDVAPTQDAYPVIQAERDMAIAQRDSARREVAHLRAALEKIVVQARLGVMPTIVAGVEPTDEQQDYVVIHDLAVNALVRRAPLAVRS